jgi:hypothetical protein
MDMDIIPLVAEEEPFVALFRYHPKTWGRQRLFQEAVPSGEGHSAEASIEVMVTLVPHEVIRLLIEEIHGLPLKSVRKKMLLAELRLAERVFRSRQTQNGTPSAQSFRCRAPGAQQEKGYCSRRKALDRTDRRPRAPPAGTLLKTTSDSILAKHDDQ